MISMRTEFLARTGASISSSQIRTVTAMRTDAMIATRARTEVWFICREWTCVDWIDRPSDGADPRNNHAHPKVFSAE